MPLIDLQRRLAEVGRIRMGEKIGNRPAKRETWRITSRDRARLEAVQAVYEGELRDWNNGGSPEFELLTEVDSLNVMVLPGQTLSQWYEMWSGGGCQRRCDGGRMIVPDDKPCVCPEDHDERATLAQRGLACKATTRLSVLLPDVKGLGTWRLETHGYYAAVELAGIADLLERATASGVMLPARLRIDQRTSIKGGQTRRYPVPMLEVEVTAHEMRALTSGESASAALSPAPALAELGPGSPEPTRGNDEGVVEAALPADVPGSDADPGPEGPAAAESESTPEKVLTEGQRRKVFAHARAQKLTDDRLRAVLQETTGQTSTAAIPAGKLDAVLAAIDGEEVAS